MTSEEIKEQTTMRDVLSRYGVVVGRNNMCSCPFHKDRKPSMRVYADGYKCFSCNRSGDIFRFVQEIENCSFKDAFLILGGEYKRQTERQKTISKIKFSSNKKKHQDKKDTEENLYKLIVKAYRQCQDAVDQEEPLSDAWCFGQTYLPIIQHIWDCMYINNEEVNEIDVIRICRKIGCKFDSVKRPIV